ncbi:unnamed protein product [Sympodiomycopsis kandeliae]
MLSLPGSALPPKRGDSKVEESTVKTGNHAPILQSRRPIPMSTTTSPSSSTPVFLPRTTRTSTGFKKAVTQMNTNELQALIERNSSVLDNPSLCSKLKEYQRQRLEEDLEVAKRRMERWIGWQNRDKGVGCSVSVTPAPTSSVSILSSDQYGNEDVITAAAGDDHISSSIQEPLHRMEIKENGAQVKQRLFNQVSSSTTTTTHHGSPPKSTLLLSNTESIQIQSRLYKEAQQQMQEKKVLRGIELMTGLGRRLGEPTGVATTRQNDQEEDDQEDDQDDEDEELIDGPQRYLDDQSDQEDDDDDDGDDDENG